MERPGIARREARQGRAASAHLPGEASTRGTRERRAGRNGCRSDDGFEAPGRRYALAMDVGGTNARAAVVDTASGAIVAAHKERHEATTPEAVTETLSRAARAAADGAGLSMDAFDAVRLGFPGPCRDGYVLQAQNLGWMEPVPLAGPLGESLGVDVVMANDLQVAALGEATFGAGRGVASSALVFIGSGVGMAFVHEGKIVKGEHGMAGEWGNQKLIGLPPERARACACGQMNCLEAFVGGKSIDTRAQEALRAGRRSLVYGLAEASLEADPSRPLEGLSAEARSEAILSRVHAGLVEQAAAQGDAFALELWRDVAGMLGAAIANLALTLDPGRIILGGGVLLGCPTLTAMVRTEVEENLPPMARHEGLLALAKLGDDAGTIGASQL